MGFGFDHEVADSGDPPVARDYDGPGLDRVAFVKHLAATDPSAAKP